MNIYTDTNTPFPCTKTIKNTNSHGFDRILNILSIFFTFQLTMKMFGCYFSKMIKSLISTVLDSRGHQVLMQPIASFDTFQLMMSLD